MGDTLLINRVAESDLQTIVLEDLVDASSIIAFDLQAFLFQGLILKEKDFREALKIYDWAALEGKHLAVYCSTDAIIPMWAYMLIASYARPYTDSIHFGEIPQVYEKLLWDQISNKDWSYLKEKRVVIKGCSDKDLPASAFLGISSALQPIVQSMMYGEPCSTVPIFKRPRKI